MKISILLSIFLFNLSLFASELVSPSFNKGSYLCTVNSATDPRQIGVTFSMVISSSSKAENATDILFEGDSLLTYKNENCSENSIYDRVEGERKADVKCSKNSLNIIIEPGAPEMILRLGEDTSKINIDMNVDSGRAQILSSCVLK